jgi:hypothetical protein
MKRIMLGLGLFLAATGAATGTANAQSVEVGEGDWSTVPEIRARGQVRMGSTMVDRLHTLAGLTSCNVQGFKASRIDLTVPFVMQFTPQGAVDRIVLRDLKCPALETALGTVVLQMAKAGEYRPTGQNPERWYRSELSFESE